MTNHRTNTNALTTPLSRRQQFMALGLVLLLAILLGLDLRFKGLAWQFFWSQTGEESIPGQILGMMQVTGNLVRSQPQTEPLAPVNHAEGTPYSINTFLQTETEADKIDEILRMIRAGGFTWLRQEFPWEDIEIDGRGQFTDTRNDYDGDGVPDTIDAWAKYDRIVDAVERYDLQMLVRLSNPPEWSRADNPSTAGGAAAPPDDLQDFVNFAVAVAERYQGRLTHYQIWNEPNIYPEWGEQFVDPAGYAEMLCRTHDALKAVDPEIVVVSAAIAPTISLDGFNGYQDVIYLQNLYDLGISECFDILAAQGYGLFSGPTDRRLRFNQTNYQRHVYYRDIMVREGDAHKPIWISEVGWTAVEDAFRPATEIADYNRFGTVTNDQLARWMPIAYQRAQEEWPWIGQMSYWFFTRATIEESDQSYYYFRIAEADYSAEDPTFTPLPVYNTMQDYIADTLDNPVLYRGTHQAESWEVTTENRLQVADTAAEFGAAIQADNISFTAQGTAISLRYRATTELVGQLDGDSITLPATETWQEATLRTSLLPQRISVLLSADDAFMVDSITVRNDLWRNLLPFGLGAVALVIGLLWRLLRRQRATTQS